MKILYKSDCERGCRKRQNEQNEWEVEMCAGCCKLADYDWLGNIPRTLRPRDIFEVRFKNTHKGFFRNTHNLPLETGDIVAVEAASGHDIGIVNLCGPIIARKLVRQNSKWTPDECRKIYRKAKPADIEKWQESIAREYPTMVQAREIAANLQLDMKIGDVEFQGDGSKAIFYYIAEGRVDFRELIKQLASAFHIRIEMRQIGVRQEAGLIGGLGICGRELCCCQWMSEFTTVNTDAPRWQDLANNAQKLSGQCGKLKCCLNHEIAVYLDAQKDFPKVQAPLEMEDGQLFRQKTDILKGEMMFTHDPSGMGEIIRLPVSRVKEIMALNKKGVRVSLSEATQEDTPKDFQDTVGEDSITRFDRKKKPRHRGGRRHRRGKKPSKNAGNA